MAFTFGFYNSLNGDRKYNAEQISAIFDGLVSDGVYDTIGDHFAVRPGNGMQIVVGTGRAWFDHTWNYNDSPLPLFVASSDITLSRYDTVVLEVNSANQVRENIIKIVNGVPGTNPTKPVLINYGDVHQHALAHIMIAPGATEIKASAIQNVVGLSECPFVTGIIKTTQIDALFQQWNGEFDEWFENVKATLTDNVVTNLQRQIDQRVKYTDKATDAEVNAATNDSHWMTPAKTKKVVETHQYQIGDIVTSESNMENRGNFFECRGQTLLKSSYPALFNIIGYKYGLRLDKTAYKIVGTDSFYSVDYKCQLNNGDGYFGSYSYLFYYNKANNTITYKQYSTTDYKLIGPYSMGNYAILLVITTSSSSSRTTTVNVFRLEGSVSGTSIGSLTIDGYASQTVGLGASIEGNVLHVIIGYRETLPIYVLNISDTMMSSSKMYNQGTTTSRPMLFNNKLIYPGRKELSISNLSGTPTAITDSNLNSFFVDFPMVFDKNYGYTGYYYSSDKKTICALNDTFIGVLKVNGSSYKYSKCQIVGDSNIFTYANSHGSGSSTFSPYLKKFGGDSRIPYVFEDGIFVFSMIISQTSGYSTSSSNKSYGVWTSIDSSNNGKIQNLNWKINNRRNRESSMHSLYSERSTCLSEMTNFQAFTYSYVDYDISNNPVYYCVSLDLYSTDSFLLPESSSVIIGSEQGLEVRDNYGIKKYIKYS